MSQRLNMFGPLGRPNAGDNGHYSSGDSLKNFLSSTTLLSEMDTIASLPGIVGMRTPDDPPERSRP